MPRQSGQRQPLDYPGVRTLFKHKACVAVPGKDIAGIEQVVKAVCGKYNGTGVHQAGIIREITGC